MKVTMTLDNIKEACGDWLMTHRHLQDVDHSVIELLDYNKNLVDEETVAVWDEEEQ